MQPEIADKLRQLNHQFYQTFAESFSQTRQRLQPGVTRILETLPPHFNILDLGCGNGELARALAERGHQGTYTGLDFSEELLSEAVTNTPPELNARFAQADLTKPTWECSLTLARYDIIFAFAVLHHIPGLELREQMLRRVRLLMTDEGRFIMSNWQFLNSDRLKGRVQPWSRIGLTAEDVDKNDYLMDWRRDGHGLRYVHHFSASELHQLAAFTGFRVIGIFTSDGEGENLGLYQIWTKKRPL
ncbi:MAG: class I SAM-dependent methyltransferase [Anaerolineales bacterium]|nr:class I SAM-dependent methyltransferase [Anaerolineales bacterium]